MNSKNKGIRSSEITDKTVYLQRRTIIKSLLAVAASGLIPDTLLAETGIPPVLTTPAASLSLTDTTPANIVQHYTNFYEFSFDKEESAELAKTLKTQPWAIEITGEVEKPLILDMDALLKSMVLKEFIYRLRCVEGWSMVVPWQGFHLADLLTMVKPLSTAKFVKFVSVTQPETMPNQAKKIMLDWPYTEGLRLDEAAHPLTIIATGMYGENLLNQNGAPLRLVVPWKYGFKSIKSIVRIELTRTPPSTTWNKFAPKDYGFYANVNPSVPHPRWSQYTERPLGGRFFTARRRTEIFNGYGEQVAGLYKDMDLGHFF